MANTYQETYDKLNKKVYQLIKRFERDNCVLVEEVNYEGDWNGDLGEEHSFVSSKMSFMWQEKIELYDKR